MLKQTLYSPNGKCVTHHELRSGVKGEMQNVCFNLICIGQRTRVKLLERKPTELFKTRFC